jgi:dihydroorotate dehydrogenase
LQRIPRSREGLQSINRNGWVIRKPLTKRSTEVIRFYLKKQSISIIGVGGIHSAEDALEKLEAGASLIQFTLVLFMKVLL